MVYVTSAQRDAMDKTPMSKTTKMTLTIAGGVVASGILITIGMNYFNKATDRAELGKRITSLDSAKSAQMGSQRMSLETVQNLSALCQEYGLQAKTVFEIRKVLENMPDSMRAAGSALTVEKILRYAKANKTNLAVGPIINGRPARGFEITGTPKQQELGVALNIVEWISIESQADIAGVVVSAQDMKKMLDEQAASDTSGVTGQPPSVTKKAGGAPLPKGSVPKTRK